MSSSVRLSSVSVTDFSPFSSGSAWWTDGHTWEHDERWFHFGFVELSGGNSQVRLSANRRAMWDQVGSLLSCAGTGGTDTQTAHLPRTVDQPCFPFLHSCPPLR
jgi:hypothetical protein